MSLPLRLALAEGWHERHVLLCHALALAAVLAPLLVLLGLKVGVVGAMTEQLRSDPRARELQVVGNRQHGAEWLARLEARPEVGFLVPRTRSIAASLYLRSGTGAGLELAEILPSAAGDPLLAPGRPRPEGQRVALSRPLAERLDAEAGDTLTGSVTRTVDGRPERQDLTLEVAQVLAAEVLERRAALVDLALVEDIERFRDGYAVPRRGWAGAPPPQGGHRYASFRLYAASLEDVGPLVEALTAEGIEVRSRSADIALVGTLERNLARVFAVIAGLGAAGVLVSLGASLWTHVERRSRDLSVLRLLGLSARQAMLLPVAQSWAIALIGLALAVGFFAVTAALINTLFGDMVPGAAACRLGPAHLGGAALITLAGASLASALAAWQAGRIEPAEGLRRA